MPLRLPLRYGRYQDLHGRPTGPIRVWDGRGTVIADMPVTPEGWEAARLLVHGPEMHTLLGRLLKDWLRYTDFEMEARLLLRRIDSPHEEDR